MMRNKLMTTQKDKQNGGFYAGTLAGTLSRR